MLRAWLASGKMRVRETTNSRAAFNRPSRLRASAAVDPSGFAELSLCDRHAFAPSAPRNRTAIVPSREKRMQSCPAASSRRFLRSGLRVCIAAFGPFPAILAAIRRNFSAIQTAWRRIQSRANRSLAKFPVTGKNTGKLKRFPPEQLPWNLLKLPFQSHPSVSPPLFEGK
jgi:hypothetical protein